MIFDGTNVEFERTAQRFDNYMETKESDDKQKFDKDDFSLLEKEPI